MHTLPFCSRRDSWLALFAPQMPFVIWLTPLLDLEVNFCNFWYTHVLMFAESLSCWPLFLVSEARSLPARSTSVNFPVRVCFSKPIFSRFETKTLRTAWLLDDVALASVLSVFLRELPSYKHAPSFVCLSHELAFVRFLDTATSVGPLRLRRIEYLLV